MKPLSIPFIVLVFTFFPTETFTHDFHRTVKRETLSTNVSVGSRIDTLISFGDADLLHQRITNDPQSAFEAVSVKKGNSLPPFISQLRLATFGQLNF